MGKKTGPKPGDYEKRTKLCGHYLTPTDWAALVDLADKGGFKSAGALTTAIVEPVIQGRLALRSGVTALSRIQAFMQANGAKFHATLADYRDGVLQLFTPPPPIAPDEDVDLSQLERDLEALLAEVRTKKTNQIT